jgi:predicted protein tyrosine phosphatase
MLFVCSQNRLRSPTAEQMFSKRENLEVDSAGTNHDAMNPVTPELIEWANVIFVMEREHRRKLQKRFGPALKTTRVVCLDIPDKYEFMEPALVLELERKLARHLPVSI